MAQAPPEDVRLVFEALAFALGYALGKTVKKIDQYFKWKWKAVEKLPQPLYQMLSSLLDLLHHFVLPLLMIIIILANWQNRGYWDTLLWFFAWGMLTQDLHYLTRSKYVPKWVAEIVEAVVRKYLGFFTSEAGYYSSEAKKTKEGEPSNNSGGG